MEGLPLTLVLAGRRCLVVGAGAVAARKIGLLLRAGAAVHVVAPCASPEVAALAASGRVRYEARRFAARDLDGAALAIAAMAERETNAAVSAAARRRGVPVNVADDPALCTVTLPAIVDRGPVTIAIATGGAAPTLARHLRARIERVVPAGVADLADFMRRVRPRVRAAVPDAGARRRLWDRLAEGPIADLAMAGRAEEAEQRLEALLAKPAAAPARGKVYLVGAGPGDPELLTLKAARLLQEADAVVHDRLVSAGVLDLARREAERVDVGKRCGRQSTPQAEINARLVSLARAGKRVVRLKGGDPFVFGRGGEEMQALLAAGIACEIVPGVTAALGCAAYAGIPLTHRDHAHACIFVTGHSSGGALDLDWASLARPLQTVCVYMGLGSLDRLVAGLVRHGVSPRMPAAIVVEGTTPRQQVLAGRLGELARLRGDVPPAAAGLVIIGEVVALRGAGAAASTVRKCRSIGEHVTTR
jgi:uroporphyrin-III C-methyltransferase/precorrin-2 dehydrogenase/sirohydrochlorin ferrochelatase